MNGTVGNSARLSPSLATPVNVLQKRHGPGWAVQAIDFAVGSRGIFGLIGPAGAGKTITIKMLCGLLEPSAVQIIRAEQTRSLHRSALRHRMRQRLREVQSPPGQPLQIQSMRPIPVSLEAAFTGIVQRSQETP